MMNMLGYCRSGAGREEWFSTANVASAGSLSVSGEKAFHLWEFTLSIVGRVLEMLGSRGVSVNEIGPVCFGTELPISRYARLGEPEIAIGHEPWIEP